ncbi:hypothetical protein ACQKNX_10325 [Lysinibacillus sp. NPDC093712]|uniref:hypothetical protein n=1 Tax=Lysinibacillus sp. NPDC093712 TaxID=3390579 RepID=UPI003D063285
MKKLKLGVAFIASFLLLFAFSLINSENAKAQSVENALDQNQQDAVNLALDEIIEEVNKQIEEGKNDIVEYRYVPEVNDFVSIKFSTENVSDDEDLETNKLTRATSSGIQSYKADVNGVSFTHTLLGDFTYAGGKVTQASKDVLASGFLFSHDKSSKITKLDPSVWQVSSTVAHKYLGVVGGITGTGYTSYIVINLYGSGNATLVRANYSSGV